VIRRSYFWSRKFIADKLSINQTNKMKKLTTVMLLVSVMIFNSMHLFSQNQTIKLDDSNQTKLELVVSTPQKLAFTSTIGKLKSASVKTDNGEFIRLSIERFGRSNNEGFPELPVLHRLIGFDKL